MAEIKFLCFSMTSIHVIQTVVVWRLLWAIPKLRWRPGNGEVDNAPWACFGGRKQKAGP